jgi:glutathione S-transferase
MTQYKLTGFHFRGLGEMSRLIFTYAKQPYENNRLEKDEWEKIKPSFAFGQLPVLEVDGVQISQSCAIARYLARQFNLAGIDDLEAAQVSFF